MLIGEMRCFQNHVEYKGRLLQLNPHAEYKMYSLENKISCNERRHYLHFIVSTQSQSLALSKQEIKLKTGSRLGEKELNRYCHDSVCSQLFLFILFNIFQTFIIHSQCKSHWPASKCQGFKCLSKMNWFLIFIRTLCNAKGQNTIFSQEICGKEAKPIFFS